MVRKVSDLPLPVAPIHNPCGPMPPCADSFKSIITGVCAGDRPIGTARREEPTRPGHSAVPDISETSVKPSRLRKDRKSTRLNSSHVAISYAVFCLKKKKRREDDRRRGAT